MSLFDVGAQILDYEEREKSQQLWEEVKEDRKERVRNLEGKFVIGMKGNSSGHTVFYQDRSIHCGGYWSRYLSNALGYDNEGQATLIKNKFRYGNPRIAKVNDGNFTWIK